MRVYIVVLSQPVRALAGWAMMGLAWAFFVGPM